MPFAIAATSIRTSIAAFARVHTASGKKAGNSTITRARTNGSISVRAAGRIEE